jgi:dipeptidase E
VFILRKAFQQSGLDKILPEKVKNNQLVYAGYSAALYIISPSLKGAEIVDDKNKNAKGYENEIIWDGLGLINYSVAVHYKSNHPESALIDKEVEYYKEKEIPFKTLKDGEVLIINN